MIDISLGGTLLVSGSPILDGSGPCHVELHIGGHEIVVHGRFVRRNCVAVAIMFHHDSRELEDLIVELGWRSREQLEHPRVLVVAPDPTCTAVAAAARRFGGVALEARTPLEALARLDEELIAIAAASISDELTQTAGVELATFIASSYPTMEVEILDDFHRTDRARIDAHVEHLLGRVRRSRLARSS